MKTDNNQCFACRQYYLQYMNLNACYKLLFIVIVLQGKKLDEDELRWMHRVDLACVDEALTY